MNQVDDRGGRPQQDTAAAPAGKRAYSRPALTVHGSVRELTGGSSGPRTGDGPTVMNMP